MTPDQSTPDQSTPARARLDADRDRHDRDGARALRVLLIVAPLLILAAVGLRLSGWQPDGSVMGLSAPVTAAVSVPLVDAPPCALIESCATEQAHRDALAGRIPAVMFGPATDGGWAVACPLGWQVDGSSVLDAHCTPADVVTPGWAR
jgi:hypothetical protein